MAYPMPATLLKTFMFQLLLFFHFMSFSSSLEPKKVRRTDLHFYMHDIVFGPGTTVVPVAAAYGNFSNFGFGTVFVIDDVLTRGPGRLSKLVGRAQGLYSWNSAQGFNLMLLFNCLFHNSAKYNGSTISIQGMDAIEQPVREVAVVGGTGHFRYARGYATIQTHSVDGYSAILKFNVTILH